MQSPVQMKIFQTHFWALNHIKNYFDVISIYHMHKYAYSCNITYTKSINDNNPEEVVEMKSAIIKRFGNGDCMYVYIKFTVK